jgi:hypothetical protein
MHSGFLYLKAGELNKRYTTAAENGFSRFLQQFFVCSAAGEEFIKFVLIEP